MRVLIQRSSSTSLTIDNQIVADINYGMVVLVGIQPDDDDDDIEYLAKKIVHLRIFDDENGVMNKSIIDVNGEILIVSQFTLMANTKKGNRPSYINAAKADIAIPIYEKFIQKTKEYSNLTVKTGVFGATMKINLTNDGPVTIWMDSKMNNGN